MTEAGITKNQIIAELCKSPHGKLDEYIPIGSAAAIAEPEFLSHLVSWNRIHGQIRDSKVALPVISLSKDQHADFVNNSLAHLATLVPRELIKALRFAHQVRTPGNTVNIRKMVERYLRAKEANWGNWTRTVVQHWASMKSLYAMYHVKPSAQADLILFKGDRPVGSIFADIANLKNMSDTEAAGVIITRKIPFLIAQGALGAKAKNPDLVLALIERMSPAELTNNSKMLAKLGINTIPALRAAYAQALERAANSKRVSTFKASVAAENVEDETIKAKLEALQEKQIQKDAGIEGNWLVLGDKSGSMQNAIEISRHVSSTLAKMVKGRVHLVFFDVQPRYVEVTGKTFEEVMAATKHVVAGGGTSIGCGLLGIMESRIDVDGIAIVSDGGENHAPRFHDVYKAYSQAIDKQIPVYFYKCNGESDTLSRYMQMAGFDMSVFDLREGIDYYSLPNLIKTMRVNRYSLIDEIMNTPLLSLDVILPRKEGAISA